MVQQFIDTVNAAFGNAWLTTWIVSMVPLIELKGAIPWGSMSGLTVFQSFLMAYLGSTVVCVPLFFLLRPILNLLKRISWFNLFACKVEYLFERKAEKIARKGRESKVFSAQGIMMLGVFGFVALPVPMTGVWTGTAVAVFLGLKFTDSIFPIAIGNLVAAAIISLLTWLLADYMNFVIIGLALVALALLVLFIVKVVRCQVPPERLAQKEENKKR